MSAILGRSRDYFHRGDLLDGAIWTVIQVHLCQTMDGTCSSSSPGRRYVVQSFRVTAVLKASCVSLALPRPHGQGQCARVNATQHLITGLWPPGLSAVIIFPSEAPLHLAFHERRRDQYQLVTGGPSSLGWGRRLRQIHRWQVFQFSTVGCNLLIYPPHPRITERAPTVSSLSAPPNWVKEANVWRVLQRRRSKAAAAHPFSAS